MQLHQNNVQARVSLAREMLRLEYTQHAQFGKTKNHKRKQTKQINKLLFQIFVSLGGSRQLSEAKAAIRLQ